MALSRRRERTRKKRLGNASNPEDSAMGGGFMRATHKILEAVRHPQGSMRMVFGGWINKQQSMSTY
jgi:hypothetical protein